ncbi:MAG: hypothetical protein OEY49_11985, partial [Candidatus Heimdallarchaeota archaeon]|nr:hypothetical protein [Candidatus Heimdallarchaeota archaeon]
ISNLGIYHSHPKGVFHSNTDDKTLINMARNYPDIISIVTNGVDTHCYKVLNEEVIKVGIEYKKIKLAFTKVVIIFDLCLPKQQSYYNLAHIIENKLLENLDREWGSQKKSKEEIKFMLPTIDVGKDYTTSIEITLGIAQSSSIITSDDIRNQLSKIIYELVLSVSPTIRWLGSQLHYYFDIPMSILPNSFARNSAIKRSELLKHFNKKESNSWKKLKN